MERNKLMSGMIFLVLTLFLANFVLADGNHEAIFEQAKELIDSRITCDELSEAQFEILGEYYMELMAPGELHEIMDARLGGEGSESLRLAHINIGKMQYCGEYAGMSGVGFMMGSGGSSGMYGGNLDSDSNSGWMGSDMGGSNYSKSYGVFGWIVGLLVIVALVLLIVWLYKKVRTKR